MRPVIKIGGSLLRSAQHFLEAAKFVSTFESPVVVVSAVKGVTDMLIELYKTRSEGFYEAIRDIHVRIAKELGVSGIEPLLKELKEALDLPEGPDVLDYYMSFGERLSAAILNGLLRRMGLDSRLFVAPLITDDDFGNAQPLEDDSLAREVDEHEGYAVVTGFIGRTRDGRFTTVGRGGSDYTATFLAKLLGYRRVILVTESPGIMTANPQEVLEAKILPIVAVEEAVEAAKLGAKNFHPRTFEPVTGGMTVEVRNYWSKGTVVGNFYAPPPYKIVVRCGEGSCVVGLEAEEIVKLGGDYVSRYAAKVPMPPKWAHDLFIKPYFEKMLWTS
ncbi:MAG: aspartate kinase [Thermoproteus sp. AZ2]|jgi:aspartate kinase|uniref:Aspartate kinase n=1 Tax=Thermoproteus sp. AZ2 TaxID=1609232 RepID=A0ACC6V3T3_9CREN